MYDNTGEITYISDANPVDIMGGKTCEVDFTCVPSGKLKAGNWKMGLGLLIDKNTKQYYPISDKVDVIVNPFQNDIVMEASDFKVLNSENVNPESITLSMNLKCVKGHYANPLRIWVRPVGSTGTWGQMMQTQFIYMEEGNIGEVNYTFCYPKGISGAEYELISNYVIPTSQSWLGTCKFRIGSASGIETIESESDPIIWYNLQGIRCEPSSPGIYIKEFNGKRNKVIIK